MTPGSFSVGLPKSPATQISSLQPSPQPEAAVVEPKYGSLFYVDVEFQDAEGGSWYEARALVDGGSQGSCIDNKVSESYLSSHVPKPIPTSMIMADGTFSTTGPITHYNPIKLCVGGNVEPYALDTTPLGHTILLGSPWLSRHNPAVNFREGELTFLSDYCRHCCTHYGKTIPLHRESKPLRPIPNLNTKPTKSTKSTKPTTQSTQSTQHVQTKPIKPKEPVKPVKSIPSTKPIESIKPKGQTANAKLFNSTKATNSRLRFRERKAPQVSLVSAAGFALACKQEGTELFFLSMKRAEDGKPVVVNNVTVEDETDLSTIPAEYHDFADLFSKKKADEIPSYGPYDHKIPLIEGSTPHWGPIYKLSPVELETLSKYIEENLQKGFIRHSQSPYGAPIVFARKKDGTLRICVDYRGLNKLTIKNRYPLPLIGELLDRISRAKVMTKFDIRDGYNRLRMAAGEEEKTAFHCRYGLFEYTVMPFGLCNAPGTFQHYMNNTFREFLDKFLVIYLDDFLVYSDNLKEHKKHVRQVMQRLREAGLYLKQSKCEFHKEEVEFLGFIVGKDGIRMDPEKVKSITSWPVPKSIHDVRMFLGLANFYRRFIKGFSKVALPITKLLRKESVSHFRWTTEAQAAFDELRTAFTTAPILQHFNPDLPTILEADASDFALGAVVSQVGEDGHIHPIAFHSRKFNPSEMNYEIYDKEMLAIVETLEHYRHYFEGLGQQITIYSDHHNLLWFTETKVYNRRQARWAEKLSKFDFKIVFRPGKEGGKPDALSRRPDYAEEAKHDNQALTFLHPNQVDTSALDSLTRIVELAAVALQSEVGTNVELKQAILDTLPTDPQIGEYLPYLQDPTINRDDETAEFLEPFTIDSEGLILHNGLVYIPMSNPIKLQILQSCHDGKVAGHWGQDKTFELVSREYYWPGMRKFINEYVRTCDTCARNKAPRHRRHGQLHPLPIPNGPWQSVSMDYIVELPPSQGYDAIYVCVDRLTKMAHFCPTITKVSAKDTADLYLRYVFKNHGLPKDIVSDRGTQFVSKFTRALLALCDIKGNRSTSFHPESDGQTERVNQTLEQYLRIYCDYHQDNWSQLLPLAEFVYNNAKNVSTGMSPFYANYGYHPRHTIRIQQPAGNTNPSADTFIQRLEEIHEELRVHLESAQQTYKDNHDKRVKAPPPFKPGDLVWLNRTNVKTSRPSQKLDVRLLGPFKVLKAVGESKLAFRLELPPQMRIHPVFHVRLLEPYHANKIEGRTQPPPPPEIIDGAEEYVVKEILDSRIIRGKLEYYVDWEGYTAEERTWEPVEHLDGAPDLIAHFHRRYPLRPSPKDIPRRSSGSRKGLL